MNEHNQLRELCLYLFNNSKDLILYEFEPEFYLHNNFEDMTAEIELNDHAVDRVLKIANSAKDAITYSYGLEEIPNDDINLSILHYLRDFLREQGMKIREQILFEIVLNKHIYCPYIENQIFQNADLITSLISSYIPENPNSRRFVSMKLDQFINKFVNDYFTETPSYTGVAAMKLLANEFVWKFIYSELFKND